MILMVSGRCDIPAFYSGWFYQRLKEGFVDVRNPFNEHQISRIRLHPDTVDVISFCTKNPIPMLERLDELQDFRYFFHVTITPYKKDIEPYVPDKKKIVEAIKQLSDKLGNQRVVVRYDPILLNDTYTIDYHIRAFDRLCEQLKGYIKTVVISFVDEYKNTRNNMHLLKLKQIKEEDMRALAAGFQKTARRTGMSIQTCAEAVDLREFDIEDRPCLCHEDLLELFPDGLSIPEGAGVRKNCGCLSTVDIGDYNCCPHRCRYCYANYDEAMIDKNMKRHVPSSSVLLGQITDEDQVVERKEKRVRQLALL